MVKESDSSKSDRQALYSNIFNDFERLANQSQDAIYHFDTVAQQFLFYNQRFQIFFQLFSSSKGKRGTGIGLFVTHKAIIKHGGSITVDSRPNKGAVFRITLPRKPI